MKNIQGLFLLVFLFGVKLVVAQSPGLDKDEEQARTYILDQYPWLGMAPYALQVENKRMSEAGVHIQFQQLYKGLPVYMGLVKVNMHSSGALLSLFSNAISISSEPITSHVKGNGKPYWYLINDKPVAVYYEEAYNEKGESEAIISDGNGNVIERKRLALFAKKDTLIQSKVFSPDPLTSAQKTYGQDGKYKNNNGADAPELNAERKDRFMNLQFENDTFYAENSYVVIKDLQSPAQTVFKSKQTNFVFTRSQSQFREFNALYHIEVYRNYLKGIGLPFTNMFKLAVDPSAHFGADQSSFEYAGSDLRLLFGTGGVPDAEDADVVVHEYTHAINYYIAPNTTNGNQRLAIEEANCDVMACLHSKSFSDFNWRWIFNWDGHNEYWDGRDGETDNKYPDDLSADFYYTSLIWSSMLNDMGEDIGRDALTRILFQSVASYANNMTMQEAVNLLLQADSLLYQKKHFGPLKQRMQERGFDVSLGLNQLSGLDPLVKLINSAEFAQGHGPLTILSRSKQGIAIELYTLSGQLFHTEFNESGSIVLRAYDFPPGAYLLKVKMGEEQAVGKLIRY